MKGWSKLTDTKNKPKNNAIVLYIAAAALSPCGFWFHVYRNNMASLDMKRVLLFALVIAGISVALFFLLTLVMSRESALLPVVLLWIVFWTFQTVHRFLNKVYPLSALNLLFIILCLLVIVCCILHKRGISRLVAMTLSCVVILLFLYNGTGPIYGAIRNALSPEPYSVKDTFALDADAGKPDVYWLHMDGMMDFRTVEKVLGEDQSEVIQALEDRGFTVNEGAELDIGWTRYSFPALTSPTIYDSYLEPLFAGMGGLTSYERRDKLYRESAYDVYLDYPRLELFRAFQEAGYGTYGFMTMFGRLEEIVPEGYAYDDAFTPERTDRIYSHNLKKVLIESSILGLFMEDASADFPLQDIKDSVPEYSEELYQIISPDTDYYFDTVRHYDRWLLRATIDSLSLPSPKLVYIQNLIPHNFFNHDENGMYRHTESEYDMSLYCPQAKYAEKIMLGTIDMILERDPDAVIVIQGDHGVHLFEREELASQGFTDDQMLEMNYSTVSAVRIPEKYGALREPLDPLDITRYLVNHFVGQGNYAYLHYREEE